MINNKKKQNKNVVVHILFSYNVARSELNKKKNILFPSIRTKNYKNIKID